MIEKLPEFLDAETFPRFKGRNDGPFQVMIEKVNELVEASNRQDRVIAMLVRNTPGGMSQYLRGVDDDFYTTLGRSEEDEAERDSQVDPT